MFQAQLNTGKNQRPNILDLVFTYKENMVDSMDYLPSFGNSGNSLLKFTFNCYLPTNVEDKETFMFHKRHFKLMSEDNANTDWGSQIKGNNIHNRSVSTDIHKNQDEHIPKTKVNSQTNKNPQVDRQASKALKTKRKTWRKYQNCKNHVTSTITI